MKIILLGAPGSGKGTLAKKISKDFDIPQISTGDLFRAIVKEDSELASKVREIMQSGGLVPDEVTIEIVKERIAKDESFGLTKEEIMHALNPDNLCGRAPKQVEQFIQMQVDPILEKYKDLIKDINVEVNV